MRDCSSQTAALELAIATEAVAYAEYIVATAEATLAMMEYYYAQGVTATARIALWYCESGYGGMMMSQQVGPVVPHDIAHQRDLVRRQKAIWLQNQRHRDELLGKTL